MAVNYLYSLDNSQPMSMEITAKVPVVKGDLLSIGGGQVSPVTAAGTGIVGIAMGSATAGQSCKVLLLSSSSVVRVPFVGSTKTSLTGADLFNTSFDWEAAKKAVNLDDTTGGFLKAVNYDNKAKTVDCVIKASTLWNE